MSIALVASITAIACFATVMVYSAVRDVLTMTVSDAVVLLLLVSFPLLAPLAGWPLDEMALSVAVALIAFFASLALFAMGCMGGGDGKLLTATILWVGGEHALGFVTWMAVAGGICALVLLGFRSLALPEALRKRPWLARLHAPETGIPYAVAIAAAGLMVLPRSSWTAGLM